jgi:hypothetical protein
MLICYQLCVVFCFVLPLPGALCASGDGPRVHGPVQVGVNLLVFHASSLNDANRSFDPSLVTPSGS